MGKNTRNFKQSKRSMNGNAGARNFAQANRSEGWHIKVLRFLKVRGKGEIVS